MYSVLILEHYTCNKVFVSPLGHRQSDTSTGLICFSCRCVPLWNWAAGVLV